jgi:hypothetical protein
MHVHLIAFALFLVQESSVMEAEAQGYSLRFHGHSVDAPGVDQVKIALDPPVPADVGGDFTLEFWLRVLPAENGNSRCAGGGGDWIYHNILFDRDVFGAGEAGDYGISQADGRIVFGVSVGSAGQSIGGTTVVRDAEWHHVAAVRRASDGWMAVFVDGAMDAEGFGAAFPSFSGWIDEVRISSVVRYDRPFPRPVSPFEPDRDTAALYHFDEGVGDVVSEVSGAIGGPSGGTRHVGGTPAGPEWLTETPLAPTGESEEQPQVVRSDTLHPLFPNPFDRETTLSFVGASSSVTLTLIDLLGRPVRTLFDGPIVADRPYRVILSGDGLPSGLFFVRLDGHLNANT